MFRFCFLFALLLPVSAFGQSLFGTATVTDGDTLRLNDVAIRLFGIDAPEIKQTCEQHDGSEWACGVWAAKQLQAFLDRRIVNCDGQTKDRYGRLVATCFVDGADIGAEMVRAGAAEAYRKYASDYVDEEKEALFAERGIWGAKHISPETYRQIVKRPETTGPSGCKIKGNVSESGRVFHVPGQADYARTRINLKRGERWFCSEAEARAAGWRKAQR